MNDNDAFAPNAKTKKVLARAAKLRSEAANCLAVALNVQEIDFSADLIDEAVKLTSRARQIEGC